MIKYERLESRTSNLRDIKVITDDEAAILAELETIFQDAEATDMQTYANIESAVQKDDGTVEFTIPGNELGDVFDFFWDIDDGKLADLVEKLQETDETAIVSTDD